MFHVLKSSEGAHNWILQYVGSLEADICYSMDYEVVVSYKISNDTGREYSLKSDEFIEHPGVK